MVMFVTLMSTKKLEYQRTPGSYACMFVEAGFRGDKGRRNYRNPNILNYIPAIKEITSRGGWVVRMGDNTMDPTSLACKI